MNRTFNIRNRVRSARNFYFPQSNMQQTFTPDRKSGDVRKNLTYYITRVQFQRIRQDIQSWRKALQQAEQMFYPYRAEMQRIFMDTVLNEHIAACMERRKNLTLLRDFKICDEKGNEDENLKKLFRNATQTNNNNWFDQFLGYTLDARFYGYTLISLGDLIRNAFPKISIIRRENISPDRENVTSLPVMIGGINFNDPQYRPWHVWVTTPGETGRETCGYGLLYKVAKAEIFLRNNTSFNADFNEVFGQPIKKMTTNKTGDERDAAEESLKAMGSQSYIVVDEDDKLELIESKGMGTGHQTFDNFEKRMESKISKLFLGHADALESTPGKLGSNTNSKPGGPESPQDRALDEIQSQDGIFVSNIVNGELIPRMQEFGFRIPPNYHFEFKNDKELAEFRRSEDESNQITANIMLTVAQAGGEPDWDWFNDRTGMSVIKKEVEPMPDASPGENLP